MKSSTEKTVASHRRKHQWIGAATLVALAALVMPWLLTPHFSLIVDEGARLTRLPDPPKTESKSFQALVIDEEALKKSSEDLDALLIGPTGSGKTASFILQVGAFKDEKNAAVVIEKLNDLNLARVYQRSGSQFIKVYLGPFLNRAEAEKAIQIIKDRLSLKPRIKQYDVREDGKL
ncbi:SPOR domain-containing protein [Litorivicinus sp.]|nr:SPOR domain-containing protein [Litorivicinus sp.]MDC1208802.1 SPOR domain-containing protein [Litorivicinus sp.]MDC1240239.1 SPOR domain-containing protein [Litorivicinus sp.]